MPLSLNYHHLYYFWTTVRAGQVTAAARSLHLSQSALSLQLINLEKSLDRRLLHRRRSGVELTEDGRGVFEHCERIFSAGEALNAALQNPERKRASYLRLGVSAALGRDVALALVDEVSRVDSCVPTLVVAPREELRERLVRRRLDAAVAGVDFSTHAGPGFKGRLLVSIPMIFVAAPALARRLGRFPRRGQEAPMLLRTREHPMRSRIDAYLEEAGVRVSLIAETEDADLLRELALKNRGVTALHELGARRDLASGRLVRVGPPATGLTHDVWLTTPEREPADQVLAEAVRRIADPALLGAAAAA